MEPEPSRESTMDDQIADMDGISNAGSDNYEEPGQITMRTPTVSSNNSTLLQNGNCRICFAPAEASGEDPMLELGCHCRDDLRFVHHSCLTKWFGRECSELEPPIASCAQECIGGKCTDNSDEQHPRSNFWTQYSRCSTDNTPASSSTRGSFGSANRNS